MMMMTMMGSGLLFSFQSLTESDELECDELDTLPLDEPDELDTAATHLIITLSRTREFRCCNEEAHLITLLPCKKWTHDYI